MILLAVILVILAAHVVLHPLRSLGCAVESVVGLILVILLVGLVTHL